MAASTRAHDGCGTGEYREGQCPSERPRYVKRQGLHDRPLSSAPAVVGLPLIARVIRTAIRTAIGTAIGTHRAAPPPPLRRDGQPRTGRGGAA